MDETLARPPVSTFQFFLVTQGVLFGGPALFAWFAAWSLPADRRVAGDILVGTPFGFFVSCLVFGLLASLGAPASGGRGSADGQSGLGEGLFVLALVGVSYSAGAGFMLASAIRRARGKRAEQGLK